MTYSQKIISDDFIDVLPEPVRGLTRWKTEIAKVFGRGPDSRWGTQLMRIASDMILVCDESLEIRHHNRAFLKGVGFTQGTFTSKNLIHFFPSEDQDDIVEAFLRLKRGHAAGMRFNATFLTMKGRRQFDTRVVRNRNLDGSFFYYLVARDITELLDDLMGAEGHAVDPLFWNLPVAAWRTDENLCILQTYGGLWTELGVAKEELIGGDLGQNEHQNLPLFLLGIDYRDTLSGMTLNTDVARNGESFNVTVEPFLDAVGRIVGTIGILRRARVLKPVIKLDRSETFSLPDEHRTHHKTRKVYLEPVAAEPVCAGRGATLRQDSIAPQTGRVSTRRSGETADLDSVALSN